MPIKINCVICNKEFSISPSRVKRNKRFCSLKCKNIWLKDWLKNGDRSTHPRWQGGNIEKKCFKCGKIVSVGRHKKDKRVFCSKSCSNSVTGKERLRTGEIIKCKVCGKEKYWTPFVLKRGQGIYCSMRCRALDNIKKQKKKNTNIEIILGAWLNNNNIINEEQKIIDGITIVDFFVEPNICIFADGDYWHTLPQNVEKDKKINKKLTERGYKIIRLWGSEIMKGVRPYEIL